MISKADYLGVHVKSKDLTPERLANIDRLLKAVNRLIQEGMKCGVIFPVNKATNSQVAGETYGGFRPQDCPIGAPKSAHKEGLAVDLYDPKGEIDTWIFESLEAKEIYENPLINLYFEHPSATLGWCHVSLKKPASGKRFFFP